MSDHTGDTAPTIARALQSAILRGLDRLDTHLLLAHVLGQSRTWLLAHDDDALAPAQAAAFAALVDRRAAGEPFAYLIGEREFHGLPLAVNPSVLVPRPDTETLVDWALRTLNTPPLLNVETPTVIDLGTGSGAIALAIKASSRATVWAVERSPAALEVARGNARELRLAIRFAQGDWWNALDGVADVPAFDLVVSNPPYIAADDPHLDALTHEPRAALVADDDGLADIACIAAGAPGRMRAGGWLLVEHGWQQGPAVRAILERVGFVAVETALDIEARPRCTGGRWPSVPA